MSLNAVLQKPKYTEDYPLFDAYFIDKEVIPNRIKFDVPPIWDQDFSAKSIGEPTAVEKLVGLGVGNYKRLTIDYALVNDQRGGPFLILDVLDNSVQNIEAPENLYVFLDGVLQREGERESYTVSGPNIFFKNPIKKEMKIDMRYLFGRDVGSILSIYDYAPDTYFSRAILQLLDFLLLSGMHILHTPGWVIKLVVPSMYINKEQMEHTICLVKFPMFIGMDLMLYGTSSLKTQS